MRFALAENVWELLISCILLVFVLGITFYLLNQYKCKARLEKTLILAHQIKRILEEIQYSHNTFYIKFVDLSVLNETNCEINIKCDKYNKKVKIIVNCGICGNKTLEINNFNILCNETYLDSLFNTLEIYYNGEKVEFITK